MTANAAIVPAGTNGAISLLASSDADVIIDVNGYFTSSAAAPSGLSLYALTPCRVLDTRNTTGLFSGTLYEVTTASSCGVPSSAQAVVLNATVVPAQPLSFLSLWPNGQSQPWVSTLNANDALVTSNIAIVPTTNGLQVRAVLTHLLSNLDLRVEISDPLFGLIALPLEAQRLGLEAYASDLNPVAVLINKALHFCSGADGIGKVCKAVPAGDQLAGLRYIGVAACRC